MSSITHICNLALQRIGKPAIQDVNDLQNSSARYCKNFWDHCRDEVLQGADWGFANQLVALAEVGTAPPGWQFSYQQPTNCLKAREIVRANPQSKPIPFQRIASDDGNSVRIVTNQQAAWLSFTARILNPVVYPTTFQEALAWRLAAELAWPLAKDKKRANECQQFYQTALSAASTVDANQAVAQESALPDSILARE